MYLQECAFYLSNINGWVKASADVHYNVRPENL